jgi:phosphatidylglycerophosphatase A
LSPFAPGTFGDAAGDPDRAAAGRIRKRSGVRRPVIIVLFLLGTWSAQITGRALRVPDHGSIVVDEVAAFLLVLYFTGVTPLRIAIAFALFRFFDIVKPPPIRQLDAAMKNGLGVMLDDMLAALYALVVFAIGQRVIG